MFFDPPTRWSEFSCRCLELLRSNPSSAEAQAANWVGRNEVGLLEVKSSEQGQRELSWRSTGNMQV